MDQFMRFDSFRLFFLNTLNPRFTLTKPETIHYLENNIPRVIAEMQVHLLRRVCEN